MILTRELEDALCLVRLKEIGESVASASAAAADDVDAPLAAHVAAMLADVSRGDFAAVLDRAVVHQKVLNMDEWATVSSPEDVEALVAESSAVLLESVSKDDAVDAAALVLLTAVAALLAFVQENFTGPALPTDGVFLSQRISACKAVADDAVRVHLTVDSEDMYVRVRFPQLLFLAKALLVTNVKKLSRKLPSASWWTGRAHLLHQECLDNPAGTLKDDMAEAYGRASKSYRKRETAAAGEDTDATVLLGALFLEQGITAHFLNDILSAKGHFDDAMATTGLEAGLSGAMGVRTKFQKKLTPQLVFHATSNLTKDDVGASADGASVVVQPSPDGIQPSEPIAKPIGGDEAAPKRVELEGDSILHEGPQTSLDPRGISNLHPLDQGIILALCLNVKNSNPKHGLTTEEMFPYVERTQRHANSWIIHSMGLLLKCRLEGERYKTAERALMQLQVLVDQYSRKYDDEEEVVPVTKRLPNFFQVAYPPHWMISHELGRRFMALGVARSALQIFEPLEMWEEVVQCHFICEEEHKAIKVVEKQLAERETPKFLCLMGDLKEEKSWYERAWDLSGRRYARAARSMGNYHIKRNEHAEAIPYFDAALRINTMYPKAWFCMGVCGLRTENWEVAIRGFSGCVREDPEEGDAWGNLASAFIATKQKREAFKALTEGLRHKRENWHMWENYVFCAMDIREFTAAINGISRLVDLGKGKDRMDLGVLNLLVHAVTKDVEDARGNTAGRLDEMLRKLFGKITASAMNNAGIWAAYADLHEGMGRAEKELDCRNKQVRALQKPGVDKDEELFNRLVDGYFELEQATMHFPSRRAWYALRLQTTNMHQRTKETMGALESWTKLGELCERALAAEKEAEAAEAAKAAE